MASASSKKTELKLCARIPNSSFPHQAFAELIILGNQMILTRSLKHFHLCKVLVKFTVKCKCTKIHFFIKNQMNFQGNFLLCREQGVKTQRAELHWKGEYFIPEVVQVNN